MKKLGVYNYVHCVDNWSQLLQNLWCLNAEAYRGPAIIYPSLARTHKYLLLWTEWSYAFFNLSSSLRRL